MKLWQHRLIGATVFVALFAVPVLAFAGAEAPGGELHTTEWHGKYEGCKATGGWAKRAWAPLKSGGTEPGPEPDPNYPGKLYDFFCKRPPKPTSTVTVPGPTATVTQPGATSTVTVTATVTATATTSPPPVLDDICHATGNGYVLISPADQGVLNGHLGHTDDIIPAPAGGCPDEQPS